MADIKTPPQTTGAEAYVILGKNAAVALDIMGGPMYSTMLKGLLAVETITMDDGKPYYYVVEDFASDGGFYSIIFWDKKKGPQPEYRLHTDFSTISSEEFGEIFRSMVRLD